MKKDVDGLDSLNDEPSPSTTMIPSFSTSLHRLGHQLVSRRTFSNGLAGASSALLWALRQLDTASLCDADKSFQSTASDESLANYTPLRVLNGLQPVNPQTPILAGTACTVQCAVPNDFLAVLEGLATYAQPDNVLVVHTRQSTKAVAGELFAAAATQQGLAGIIVLDGPMRDSYPIVQDDTMVRCYSKSLTPYSGTTQHVGEYNLPLVDSCEGITISPGDILVGDNDGVIVAPPSTFGSILEIAQSIQQAEASILDKMKTQGRSLQSLTNFDEHVQTIRDGRPSTLQFKV